MKHIFGQRVTACRAKKGNCTRPHLETVQVCTVVPVVASSVTWVLPPSANLAVPVAWRCPPCRHRESQSPLGPATLFLAVLPSARAIPCATATLQPATRRMPRARVPTARGVAQRSAAQEARLFAWAPVRRRGGHCRAAHVPLYNPLPRSFLCAVITSRRARWPRPPPSRRGDCVG